MRNRKMVVSLLALALIAAFAAPAFAASSFVVAQQEEDTGQGQEGTESGEVGGESEGGAGQDDAEAETDPGSGEEAETETGPPWTYQMARMGVGLLVLLGLAIGLAWYRFVGSRQRVT